MSAPISIRDLAELLHRPSDSRKALALLRVYLDDSGTHEGSPITAIGGFVGDAESWESLETKWAEALDTFNVDAFRSNDCQQGEGHFARTPADLRLACALRLARIITDEQHEFLPVWSAVINEDWEAAVTDEFRASYPAPVYLCFANIARALAEWSGQSGGKYPIALIYSEQNETRDQIADIWDSYKRNKAAANLSSFTSTHYAACRPLQAADLFAYEMNIDWQNREYGIFGDPPPLHYFERKPLNIIRERFGVHFGGAYDAHALQAAMKRGGP